MIEYTYDYLDRRILRKADANGSVAGGVDWFYNVYQGDNAALEIHDANSLATGGTGQNVPHVEHRYLYGAAVDEILASENAAGTVLWGLADHEGTIRDIVDSTRVDSTCVAPLIGSWGFEEAPGSTVQDASPNGNDGQLSANPPTRVAGPYGYALQFNGSNNSVSIPTSPSFDAIAGSFTVQLTFRYDGAGAAGKEYWTLLNQNSIGGGQYDPYHLMIYAGGYLVARVGGVSGEDYLTVPAPLNVGQFYQTALVYDAATKTYTLYLDGQAQVAHTEPSNWTAAHNSGPLTLGVWPAYGDYFNGVIDEVRIVGRALSAAELANSEIDSLVGSWSFEEASGSTVQDASPNGNDGQFSANRPTRIAGLHGDALKFNGKDNSVTIPGSSSLAIDGSFTVELTFRYDGPGTPDRQYWTLLNKNARDGFYELCHLWIKSSNKHLQFRVSNGATFYEVDSGVAVDDGAYHAVALVYDHIAKNYKLYFDEQLVKTQQMDQYWTPQYNSDAIVLGSWGGYSWFNGVIDEVRMVGRALSAAELGRGVLNHRTYDGFGTVTEYNSAGVEVTDGPLSADFPQSYTGKSYDAAAGLFYYARRWYDSATGRFASADPAGLSVDTNLYRYVVNDPYNNTDPTGLCLKSLTDFASGFYSDVSGLASDAYSPFGSMASNLYGSVSSLHSLASSYEAPPRIAFSFSSRTVDRATDNHLIIVFDTSDGVERYGPVYDPDLAEMAAASRQSRRLNEMTSALDRVRADRNLSTDEMLYQCYKIAKSYGDHSVAGAYRQSLVSRPSQTQIDTGPAIGFAGMVASPFIDLGMGGRTSLTRRSLQRISSAQDDLRRTVLEGATGYTHEDLVVGLGQSTQNAFTGSYSSDRQWILNQPGTRAFDVGVSIGTDPLLYAGAGMKAVGMLSRISEMPTLEISATRYPNLAENVRNAQMAGHPNILTYGGNAAANRAAALEGVPRILGFGRDEYPFASTLEGGGGSWVGHVPSSEHGAQGGILKNFYQQNNIQPGAQFRVIVGE